MGLKFYLLVPIQAIWILNSAKDSPSQLRRFLDTPSSPKPSKTLVVDDLLETRSTNHNSPWVKYKKRVIE